MTRRRLSSFAIVSRALLLCLLAFPAAALGAWPAPWSVNAAEPVTPEAARVEKAAPPPPFGQTSVPKIFLLGAVRGYQVGISPADGASCSMYPTCSGYAVLSLRKHGPVTGFVLTSERVMRNHGGPQYPAIEKFGHWRYHDPVEANDYWFPSVRRGLLLAIQARNEAALAQRRAAGLEE
jgi:putative membrane protein insertion efficiency factor